MMVLQRQQRDRQSLRCATYLARTGRGRRRGTYRWRRGSGVEAGGRRQSRENSSGTSQQHGSETILDKHDDSDDSGGLDGGLTAAVFQRRAAVFWRPLKRPNMLSWPRPLLRPASDLSSARRDRQAP